jgi:hypothetical protein
VSGFKDTAFRVMQFSCGWKINVIYTILCQCLQDATLDE